MVFHHRICCQRAAASGPLQRDVRAGLDMARGILRITAAGRIQPCLAAVQPDSICRSTLASGIAAACDTRKAMISKYNGVSKGTVLFDTLFLDDKGDGSRCHLFFLKFFGPLCGPHTNYC